MAIEYGSVFFVLQVRVMCMGGRDALIVSKMIGASEIAKLSVAWLFQFMAVGIAISSSRALLKKRIFTHLLAPEEQCMRSAYEPCTSDFPRKPSKWPMTCHNRS
jgi:hypothetical protein